MKGKIGNQKGILIPYQEFCKEIGLPKGYIPIWFYCTRERIVFTLIKKLSVKIKEEGLIKILARVKGYLWYGCMIENSFTLYKNKIKFLEKLGLKQKECNNFADLYVVQLGEDGRRIRLDFTSFKFALAKKEKNIYVWISEIPRHPKYREYQFTKIKGNIGKIETEKGALIPYQEFCQKAGIPKSHTIEWGHCLGGYVTIKLIKFSPAKVKEDIVIPDYDDNVSLVARKKGTELLKELGVSFKSKEIDDLEIYSKDEKGNLFAVTSPEVEFALKKNANNVFVWIKEGVHPSQYKDEYFVKTE